MVIAEWVDDEVSDSYGSISLVKNSPVWANWSDWTLQSTLLQNTLQFSVHTFLDNTLKNTLVHYWIP